MNFRREWRSFRVFKFSWSPLRASVGATRCWATGDECETAGSTFAAGFGAEETAAASSPRRVARRFPTNSTGWYSAILGAVLRRSSVLRMRGSVRRPGRRPRVTATGSDSFEFEFEFELGAAVLLA